MVVDDDPGVRALTVNALSYCVNRDVVSFGDGRAAWEYFKGGNAADLVIADVDMPGMDGLELLKRFKLKWETGIFICMSGRPQNGTAAEAAGADAFLGKPFTINDLFSIIQEYVVD
ncbi:MAG: response regulator [Desulfobacter sp.]|nr:MAG: response regulator [Desulfobacter sp.]